MWTMVAYMTKRPCLSSTAQGRLEPARLPMETRSSESRWPTGACTRPQSEGTQGRGDVEGRVAPGAARELARRDMR